MKHLIPIYREKELFTIFYDTTQQQLVKLHHRRRTYGTLILWHFFMIRIISKIENFYHSLQNIILQGIMIIVLFYLSYLGSRIFYKKYYLQETIGSVFNNDIYLQKVFKNGRKQFRLERRITFIVCIAFIISLGLFIVTNHFANMIFAYLSFLPINIFLFTRPIKRHYLLKQLEGELL